MECVFLVFIAPLMMDRALAIPQLDDLGCCSMHEGSCTFKWKRNEKDSLWTQNQHYLDDDDQPETTPTMVNDYRWG